MQNRTATLINDFEKKKKNVFNWLIHKFEWRMQQFLANKLNNRLFTSTSLPTKNMWCPCDKCLPPLRYHDGINDVANFPSSNLKKMRQTTANNFISLYSQEMKSILKTYKRLKSFPNRWWFSWSEWPSALALLALDIRIGWQAGTRSGSPTLNAY